MKKQDRNQILDYCENCLYLNSKHICICQNSEMHQIKIDNPLCCSCNNYVPCWQEGYGDI